MPYFISYFQILSVRVAETTWDFSFPMSIFVMLVVPHVT